MTLSEYSPYTQSTRSLNQVKPGPYVARLDPGHASLCPVLLIGAGILPGKITLKGTRS